MEMEMGILEPGPLATFRPLSASQKSDKSHYKNIKTPKTKNQKTQKQNKPKNET